MDMGVQQTLPRDIAQYIAGFADGEGSFHISFRRRDDYLLGWKITPTFNISQKERDILALIQGHMGCGTVRFRKDGVWAYEVSDQRMVRTRIVPFFQTYPFLSTKKRADFARFERVLAILDRHASVTYADCIDILAELESQANASTRRGRLARIHARAFEYWTRNRAHIELRNRQIPRDYTPNEVRCPQRRIALDDIVRSSSREGGPVDNGAPSNRYRFEVGTTGTFPALRETEHRNHGRS